MRVEPVYRGLSHGGGLSRAHCWQPVTCCKACLLSGVHLFGQQILSVYELPRAAACPTPMWVCSKLLLYEFLTRRFLCPSRFYGALLGTVCVLYLLPLCWVFALLNSTLFLGNVEFFRGKP